MGKIHLVGDRVIVRAAAKAEMTRSGIAIPDPLEEKPQERIIMIVGKSSLLENGECATLDRHEDTAFCSPGPGGTAFK